jgi:hypothetical protein
MVAVSLVELEIGVQGRKAVANKDGKLRRGSAEHPSQAWFQLGDILAH